MGTAGRCRSGEGECNGTGPRSFGAALWARDGGAGMSTACDMQLCGDDLIINLTTDYAVG
ncbi:hypothetical protein FHX69_5984 [Prauserella muralis]|nr:hypothetical protein FHX69_5984 [Prauserella muralis]